MKAPSNPAPGSSASVAPAIEAEQLQLLAPWHSRNGRDSRTLDFFDAIPKYPFSRTRTAENFEPETATFTVENERYRVAVQPAAIKDAQSGRTVPVFPGGREELVERALRFLAVQQLAQTQITPDQRVGTHGITVFFTLSALRRHLQELGHGYKLSEIKEALNILSKTLLEVIREGPEEGTSGKGKKRRRFVTATILSSYAGDFAEGDKTGEDSRAAVTFHPLATEAIFAAAYYPINQTRVGKLKLSLSRWLTTRMSHNYRQAGKDKLLRGEGYHISLATILDERGLASQERLRNNLQDVRRTLIEMRKEGILRGPKDFPNGPSHDEKLSYVATRGRKKVVDAVWTLYPSPKFIEEIIQGNQAMLPIRLESARASAGGNRSESWPKTGGNQSER
jgi:hypothetical protein